MIIIKNSALFCERALDWAAQFAPVCYLTDNNAVATSGFPQLLAVAAKSEIKADENAFHSFEIWLSKHEKQWKFGYFSYDLKNELENLTVFSPESRDNLNADSHFGSIDFPALHFFIPRFLFIFNAENVEIFCQKNDEYLLENLLKNENSNIINKNENEKTPQKIEKNENDYPKNLKLQAKILKQTYLEKISKLKQHIIDGDVYEINFCQAFSIENIKINPIAVFHNLNKRTRSPFATYYTVEGQHLLCASPERFLQKKQNTLISQPIKGTIRRGKTVEEDEFLKNKLQNSEKDRAENVMIVDLVRNDLAQTCEIGSVCVPELFAIYSFPQVHQLISTVQGTLRKDTHWLEALKRAFPMGSMTGAPKIMAMELITQYENTKRGLFSGAVGYISPDDDFDFNVVIRSIFYNEKKQYLAAQVGGAIVFDSDAESEYDECLLKLKAIEETIATF